MKRSPLLLLIAWLLCTSAHAADDTERARDLAQKLLKEHGRDGSTATLPARPSTPESFAEAHARRSLSLEGLKNRAPASSPALNAEQILSVFGTPSRGPASAPVTEPAHNDWSLVFMALLGTLAGLAVAYVLFLRPQRAVVSLMIPGNGEHFSIRMASRPGEYILDIMNVRGDLIRSAGMLRPNSVARAAVLPPELAARLGAKGGFDRFEFTAEGAFVKTDKEEGYQVFPFVLE